MPCLIALATFEKRSRPALPATHTSMKGLKATLPCNVEQDGARAQQTDTLNAAEKVEWQCSIRFNPKPCPFLNLAHLSSILSKTRTDSSKTRLVAAGAPSASKLGTPLSKASLPSDSRPINRDPHAALPACHPNPALDKRKRFGCGVVPWREPRLPLSQ